MRRLKHFKGRREKGDVVDIEAKKLIS